MEILKHAGPNWTRGCAALNYKHDLLAVCVRSSVVLVRAEDGKYMGEIRLPGRTAVRSSALAFAQARPLEHLLAVGHEDGIVRVYDVHARLVVRNLQIPANDSTGSVAAVCFGAATPNLLFVLRDHGWLTMYDLANYVDDKKTVPSKHSWCIKDTVHRPCCLSSSLASPCVVFVGGSVHDQSSGFSSTIDPPAKGVIVAVDLRSGLICDTLICGTGVVSGFDVFDTPDSTFIVCVSGKHCVPSVSQWRSLGFHGAHEGKGCDIPVKKDAQGVSNAAVSWLHDKHEGSLLVVSSTSSGGIHLWRFSPATKSLDHLSGTNDVHSRQLFALLPKQASSLQEAHVVTAGMDRCLKLLSLSLSSEQISNNAGGSLRYAVRWNHLGAMGHVQALFCVPFKKADSLIRAGVDAVVSEASSSFPCPAPDLHLLFSCFGDGSLYMDCILHDQRDNMKLHSLCRRQIQRAKGGVAVSATALSYSYTAAGMDSDNISYPAAIFGTSDCRIGYCDFDPLSDTVSSSNRSNLIMSSRCSSPRLRRQAVHDGKHVKNDLIVRVERVNKNSVLALSARGCLSLWGVPANLASDDISEKGFQNMFEYLSTTGGAIACFCKFELHRQVEYSERMHASSENDCNAFLLITITGQICGIKCSALQSYFPNRKAIRWSQLAFDAKSDICCAAYLQHQSLAIGTVAGDVALYGIDLGDKDMDGCVEILRSRLLWKNVGAHSRRITHLEWQPAVGDDFKTSSANIRQYHAKFGFHEDLHKSDIPNFVASASEDGTVRLFSRENGHEEMCLRGHFGQVLCMCWKSFHTILTGGADWSVRLWDILRLPKSN